MIHVAIVEDEKISANILQKYIQRYIENSKIDIKFKHFENAESFLGDSQPYDLVFMDIELPGLNGMDAAFKLRKINSHIIIIFVTNTAQFAVSGYSVNALDYIVKPMQYSKFSQKMGKVLDIMDSSQNVEIVVSQPTGLVFLYSSEIQYIEVDGHKIQYHTKNKIVTGYGTLSNLEEKLKTVNFMRCKSCYLLNPKYIQTVNGLNVIMRNGDRLKISQPKRKRFMSELSDWLGRGNF